MDYRLPIRRPVVVAKKTEKPKEIIEKNEETEQVSTDNVIHLSISDSVGLKESFG
jgi:hypothetical protein